MATDLVIKASQIVLSGGKHVDDGSPRYIIVRDGVIVDILSHEPDTQGLEILQADLVLPGFVDIHTHGVGGDNEVVNYWKKPDYTASRVVRWGTTSLLASLTFPKDDPLHTTEIMQTIKAIVGKPLKGCAIIEGIHAEGPIVADLGGLVPSSQRMPITEFASFVSILVDAGLRIMTIAPSVDRLDEYARTRILLEHGVMPAFGHDKHANETDIIGALRVCAKWKHQQLAAPTPRLRAIDRAHVTHLFNVQTFGHREIGLANIGLLRQFPKGMIGDDEQYGGGIVPPTIEVIGDFVHLHPLVMQLILNAKPIEDICFITDAIIDCEAPRGTRATYGGRPIEVSCDIGAGAKCAVLCGRSTLVGSCTTQLDIFHALVGKLGVAIGDASRMLSENPARIAGIDVHTGSIAVGKRADLLCFSKNHQKGACEWVLERTYVAGHLTYQR